MLTLPQGCGNEASACVLHAARKGNPPEVPGRPTTCLRSSIMGAVGMARAGHRALDVAQLGLNVRLQ
jgi:hypothetical protein